MASVQASNEQLDKYQLWLKKYGRSPATAEQYAKHVRLAYEAGGPFERLVDVDLSPKTLQLTKAALKAWALFQGDSELLGELNKVRLPPAIRQKEDVPLTMPEWTKLRREIDEKATYLKDPMRAVLGLLTCRGFRCGDVLRIKRKEVVTGLRKGVLDYEGKGRKRIKWTVADYWRGYLEVLVDYKDWERVEDLICPKSPPGKTRRESSGKAITRALEKCASNIGVDVEDIHPHLLRHTYASFYYDLCRDPKKLQDHMCWSDIKIAMGYVAASSKDELDSIADDMFQ